MSTAAWLARDLDGAGVLPVTHDFGVSDLPDDPGAVAWWCPQNYAARLLRAGVDPFFQSCGSGFLRRVHAADVRGLAVRDTWSGPLYGLPTIDGEGFFKPAEAKVDALPSGFYRSSADFASKARAAGLDNTSVVEWSEPVDFATEYRHFVAHGQVVASSMYLHINEDSTEFTWDAWPDAESSPFAGDFVAPVAQRVVDALGSSQPDGWVLDIGLDREHRAHVIEANAAWSSNPYHCDPAGVVASILAAQGDPKSKFLWSPDPSLVNRAAQSRPLRK